MADAINIPVIIDTLLDSLAIISIFITLYVLRKIIKIASEFSLKAPTKVNEEILQYIRQSNEEDHTTIKTGLDIFEKHIDKIDDVVRSQVKYIDISCEMITKLENITDRQEKIISKLEAMISKQQDMITGQLNALSSQLDILKQQQQSSESATNQNNQSKNENEKR